MGQRPSLRCSDLTNYFYLLQQKSSLLQPLCCLGAVCQQQRSSQGWEMTSFCFGLWHFACSLPLLGGGSQNQELLLSEKLELEKLGLGRLGISGLVPGCTHLLSRLWLPIFLLSNWDTNLAWKWVKAGAECVGLAPALAKCGIPLWVLNRAQDIENC